MDVVQLQRKFLEYTTSLFNEELQDESNPDFVVELVSLFFADSDKLINDLTRALDPNNVDFNKVDAHVHKLRGSSSSIGAKRVTKACIALRNVCNEQNVEGCLRWLVQVKQEYLLVKSKLETLLNLEKQIVQAGGVVPKMG